MKRFDIVVLNHARLHSWFDNFDRIRGFDPTLDRVTVVSCSPCEEETRLIRNFESRHGFQIRYLTRENRGLAEMARVDYFTGAVGTLSSNLAYDFIFQMQEHYLDTESSFSRWGPELGLAVKGDVVPDGASFDLAALYDTLTLNDLSGAFCDRKNPCWFSIGRERYIAPCGGNFLIRSSEVATRRVRRVCRALRRAHDGSYAWALYAEFMWGFAFFQEGKRFYDIKRERVVSRWDPAEYYIAPDDVAELRLRYDAALIPGARRLLKRIRLRSRVRSALTRVRRS